MITIKHNDKKTYSNIFYGFMGCILFKFVFFFAGLSFFTQRFHAVVHFRQLVHLLLRHHHFGVSLVSPYY